MAVLALFLLSALSADPRDEKAIYGDDDRVDYFELSSNDPFKTLVERSIVAMMSKSFLNNRFSSLTGTYNIFDSALVDLNSLGRNRNLCSDQKFFHDPAYSSCSGTLIAPDRILTAGHCLSTATACSNAAFVFGYYVTGRDSSGVPSFSHQIRTNDVYFCRNVEFILDPTTSTRKQDYAVVHLDRSVDSSKTPVSIDNEPTAYNVGQDVVLAGCPSGIPIKVAKNAEITRLTSSVFFQATVDAFAGNSGSGVFLPSGHQAGILVRGNADYVDRGSCKIVADTSALSSSAEQVTYAHFHKDVIDCKESSDCPNGHFCDRLCAADSTDCTGFCVLIPNPNAQAIGNISFADTVSGSTAGRRNQFGNPSGDVVYRIRVTETAEYKFMSCDSEYDTVLALLDVNGTVLVSCDDLTDSNPQCSCSGCCSLFVRSVLKATIAPDDEVFLLIEGGVVGSFTSSGNYKVTMSATNACPLALPLIEQNCASPSCPVAKASPGDSCCNPLGVYIAESCDDSVASVVSVPSQCVNITATTFSSFEKTCPSPSSALGFAFALIAPLLLILFSSHV